MRKILGNEKYGNFEVEIYQTEEDIIVYEMKGFIANDNISKYINDLLGYAETHKPKAMIADPRKMKVLSVEVQEAVQNNFWPKIAELGIMYNPVIMPESTLSSGSIKRMIKNTQIVDLKNGGIMEIGTFGSMDDAVKWISSKLAIA